MRVGISVELRGRNGRHANLLDQEPRKLEVARAVRDVRGEGVAVGDFNGSHVDEDEVAAFGVGVLVLVSDGVYSGRRDNLRGGQAQ